LNPVSLPQGTVLRVWWEDSTALHGWQFNYEPIERLPASLTSLGYIVHSDSKALALTTTLTRDGHSMSDLVIPWSCISDLEVLEEILE